jgi:hypothetical protein
VKWLPFVACYFIPRGSTEFFPLFSSLSLFSSLDASFFGCFQPFWFFQMPLPSFFFGLSARFMFLGSLLRALVKCSEALWNSGFGVWAAARN